MPEPGDVRRWLVPSLIVIGLLIFASLGRLGGGGAIVGAVPGPQSGVRVQPSGGAGLGGAAQGGGLDSGSPGTVVTTRGFMLPLAVGIGIGGKLSGFTGMRSIGTGVRVEAVDADEGFWIGTTTHDRIWVQLVGPPPESPYTVRTGDRVSFDALVVSHTSRFARRVGVTRAEGARLLTAQGAHIAVQKRELKLTHG